MVAWVFDGSALETGLSSEQGLLLILKDKTGATRHTIFAQLVTSTAGYVPRVTCINIIAIFDQPRRLDHNHARSSPMSCCPLGTGTFHKWRVALPRGVERVAPAFIKAPRAVDPLRANRRGSTGDLELAAPWAEH